MAVFVVPGYFNLFQCVKVCANLNATLPCIHNNADFSTLCEAGSAHSTRPLIWLGFHQSASALGTDGGWTIRATESPNNWVAPWCGKRTSEWPIPWGDGEPGKYPGAPFGCAVTDIDKHQVYHAGCEITLQGPMMPMCMCHRPPPGADPTPTTDAFSALAAASHEKELGMYRMMQGWDFAVRTAGVLIMGGILFAFWSCLLCSGCEWSLHLAKVGPAAASPLATAPRRCCCGACDHMQAREVHGGNISVHTEAFDCLRGIAAMQVAIGHLLLFWASNLLPSGVYAGGGNAVLLFFLMSGFVMQVGYAGKGPADGSCCGSRLLGCGGHFAKNFWGRRLARLGPVAWLGIAIYLPIASYEQLGRVGALPGVMQGIFLAEDVAMSSTFTSTWLKAGVNGPLWTLTAQMFLYLLFPAITDRCHAVWSSISLISFVFGLWLLYVLMWLGAAGYKISDATYLQAHCDPLNKVPLFIAGMVLGSQALIQAGREKVEEAASSLVNAWGMCASFLAVLLLLYTFIGLLPETDGYLMRVIGELTLPPIYLLLLYSLARSPDSLTARLFRWQPFRFLGKISFCIYVLQFPIFHYYYWARAAFAGRDYWISSRHSSWLDAIIVLALLLGLSTFVHHTIEEPGRSLLQRWLQPASPVVVQAPLGVDGSEGGTAHLALLQHGSPLGSVVHLQEAAVALRANPEGREMDFVRVSIATEGA